MKKDILDTDQNFRLKKSEKRALKKKARESERSVASLIRITLKEAGLI